MTDLKKKMLTNLNTFVYHSLKFGQRCSGLQKRSIICKKRGIERRCSRGVVSRRKKDSFVLVPSVCIWCAATGLIREASLGPTSKKCWLRAVQIALPSLILFPLTIR
ncbi:uncharacterized protein LOC144427407 [Styela clava]